MRVLFTSTAGDGHVLPMLPLAGAFAARGDDVAFAAPANHRERIDGLGLRFTQAGATIEEMKPEIDAHRARVRLLPTAARAAAFSGRFAEIEAPRRLQPLQELLEAYRPDLLVHEAADLAAPLAAAVTGVPTINHAYGRSVPEPALRRAAEAMAHHWSAAGLEPDELAGTFRGGYVEICPPSFRAQLGGTPSRIHVLRPAEASAPSGAPRDRQLVYATLGTSVNEPRTFRLLLDAFKGVDCDVVMTIGRNRDPRDLEPIPANATVERYIPQAEILGDCDAVVAHAGSGSVLAALAHGLPMVLLPHGADQFGNADACERLGVAEKILPADLAAERVRAAVQRVLGDAAFAGAAQAVAAEIAAMPTADAVADEIAAQR